MWFLEQLSPGNSAYNIRGAIKITGLLNADMDRVSMKLSGVMKTYELPFISLTSNQDR